MSKVDDKREAILGATLKLVSEHGFHGAAMSKIAKEAGVSAGIIYHYFENKDQLMVELYKSIKREGVKVQLADHDPNLPMRAQIRNLWSTMIRYYLKHQQVTTFAMQFTSSPYFTAEVEQEVLVIWKPVMDLFERAKKEEIIKDLPYAVYGTFILDVPSALARRETRGEVELTEELLEQVTESLWSAIRT